MKTIEQKIEEYFNSKPTNVEEFSKRLVFALEYQKEIEQFLREKIEGIYERNNY